MRKILGNLILGFDLNIGKLTNKTVIPPEYSKDKVADNPYDVKTKPKLQIDGKIGNFKQSPCPEMGDCWLLAGSVALADTKKGAEIIKNSIFQDQHGNVNVMLQGVGKTYSFSPEEIDYAYGEGRTSSGDDDVKVIELAVAKKNKESMEEIKTKLDKNELGFDIDVSSLEAGLKAPLDGGRGISAFDILTDNHSDFIHSYNGMLKKDPSLAHKAQIKNQQVTNFLNAKEKYHDRFALTVGFVSDKGDMVRGHEFAVKRVDKKHVFLVNPWDTSKKVRITRKEFMKNYSEISVCDLDYRRSKDDGI